LPKPTGIRTMLMIIYFKIVLFSLGVASLLSNTQDLTEVSSKNVVSMIFLMIFALTSMILLIILINKRKLWPSILLSFVVLFFSVSLNLIQVILSLFILLLFFGKKTRAYFRSENAIESEPEAEAQELFLEDGDESEGQVVSLPKPKSKTKRDPEVYIREATAEDADTIHALMLIAFDEYKNAIPPSSALEETEEAIAEALREERESAAILYEDDTAIAMVRFKYVDDVIFFFRLSVIPARRRRGYARQLVKWIEKQGVTKGLNISRCKVRQSIQNNLVLYQDMGYEIVDQELIVRPAGTVKALTLDKQLGL
jgi:ribosomal protein S18 acetylase RimI-like enzyme